MVVQFSTPQSGCNAIIVYAGTVHFCDRFVDKRSRRHDQMVQAARSGKQNIMEGGQASGTSTETPKEGGLRERMTRARLAARAQHQSGSS